MISGSCHILCLCLCFFLWYLSLFKSFCVSLSVSHMYYCVCLPAFILSLICISFRLPSSFLFTPALLISSSPLHTPSCVKLIIQIVINYMRSYEAAQCSPGTFYSIHSHCYEILHLSHWHRGCMPVLYISGLDIHSINSTSNIKTCCSRSRYLLFLLILSYRQSKTTYGNLMSWQGAFLWGLNIL